MEEQKWEIVSSGGIPAVQGPSQAECEWEKVWCGGVSADQDVTILLMQRTAGMEHRHNQTLAELKVHSTRLRKCSKYFETCMSQRWAKPSAGAALGFVLDVHAEIACYKDCFSRMYTPFLKDFKDVTYSLELLKVACQIQFHDLMSSICRYLSTVIWFAEDELRIREYASSPDFPRDHAKDLVARLDLGGSQEEFWKLSCEAIEQCIRSALRHEGDFLFHRALFEELLRSIGQSLSPTFEKDLVMTIVREAKDMILKFHGDCDGRGITQVQGFTAKLSTICWVLKALLRACVGEEVVEYFLHLELYPKILKNAVKHNEDTEVVAIDFAGVILLIFQGVVTGNLLLGISDRVALLKNWRFLLKILPEDRSGQPAEDLFLTLPFKQQMDVIKLRSDDNNCYISTSSLARLLKSKWPVEEEVMQAEEEVEAADPFHYMDS